MTASDLIWPSTSCLLATRRDEAETRQPVEHDSGEVFSDRERQEEAFGVTVAGQVDDARGLRGNRIGTSNRRRPTEISPETGSSPASPRRNSRWPLPSTPASPTTSPGRTSKIDSLQDGVGRFAHHHGRNGARVQLALLWESAFDRAPDNEGEDLAARKCRRPRTCRESGRHEGS